MILKSRGSKNYIAALIIVIILIIAYFYMSRQESVNTDSKQTTTKTPKIN